MLLSADGYVETWKEVRKQVVSHSTCKLVIIVSCLDVDAVCATKMLVRLLKKDLILHQIIPVCGQSTLIENFKTLDADVTNVMLVGCGASFDLDEVLGEHLQGRKVHIFDNHRPWDPQNLFGSDNILCYDDGNFDELEPIESAYRYLAENPEPETSDDDDEVYAPKRKREDAERQQNAAELAAYMNQGSYLFSTNTVQVYTLLSAIGETNRHNLWLMIVGVCALESQAPEIYLSLFSIIHDEMRRLANRSDTEIEIDVQKDFALFLLRDWNLYDSMVHSNYLASKLGLWKENGRKKLHKMLARMGIPLQEARENWVHMDQSLKKELKENFEEVTALYGIDNILRLGVVRKYGYQGTVSASDCAEAVAAMLEDYGPSPTFWIDNFRAAWEGLENFNRLKSGMEKAKILQRVIVAAATGAFEKGQPKNLRSYRLVVVQESPDLEKLANPLVLQRLGIWIADSCAEELAYASLPLVVASFNEQQNNYLVLGLAARRKRDDVTSTSAPVKNQFGAKFQEVAESINAHITIDAFDSAVITVKKEELSRFLESLAAKVSQR